VTKTKEYLTVGTYEEDNSVTKWLFCRRHLMLR